MSDNQTPGLYHPIPNSDSAEKCFTDAMEHQLSDEIWIVVKIHYTYVKFTLCINYLQIELCLVMLALYSNVVCNVCC